MSSSRTVVIQFSEAEIKRQAAGNALTLRDARYPGLRFRFIGDRTAGSWYLLVSRSWKKVAGYPQLPVRWMLEILPELHAKHALGQSVTAGSQFSTVGDLLRWYGERVSRDRSLSRQRKQSVESIIRCQLAPRIASMPIVDVTRESLDRSLMWPMQAEQALSYVRQCLRVLQQAFARAESLGHLSENPLQGIKFTDFSKARVKPKPAQLSMLELPALLDKLTGRFESEPVGTMLAIMQLAHGTRIGETRQARWQHISLTSKVWVIPAEHTKTKTEHTLPLTDRMCELLTLYKQRMGSRATPSSGLFVQQVNGKTITAAMALAHIRTLSGGDWSSHDLRKLARTGWVELGIDYLIGEMLLNHAMGFSAETYVNTSAAELKHEALARWHEMLDENGLNKLALPACDMAGKDAIPSSTDAEQRLIPKTARPA